MADETAQPDTPTRASDFYAEAMRELAAAIHDLAGAIRESASFAGELEWVPCDDAGDAESLDAGAAGASDGRTRDDETGASGTADSQSADAGPEDSADGTDARAPLELVPIQHAEDSNGRPETGDLCRAGGCRCEEADEGVGRHARRDPAVTLVDETQCCRAVPASAR